MADNYSPEFNAKMHEAFVNGYTPEEVATHLSTSKDPEHQRWVASMNSMPSENPQDVAPNRPDPVAEDQRDTSTPLLDTYGKTVQQAQEATSDMPLGEKIAYGAGAAVLAGSAGAIGNRLLSRILPTPTEKATALQAKTYARATELEALRNENKSSGNPIEDARVREIEAKIARENAAHQLEIEQKKELHQAKLAKINEKLMKGETVGPENITPAEPTKGLAELENATGGPLSTATDVRLAQRFQAQNTPSSSPVAPPPAPAPQAPVAPPEPAKVAEASTQPSPVSGGAPVAPGGDQTVDLNAVKESALTPVEKVESPTLAQNVQAKTDIQNKTIKDAVVKPLTTGSGMPAFQGTAPEGTRLKKEFAGLHEIPSTHAFVPSGQYMDILRNAIGQEAFTSGLKNAGGYPETPEKAYEISRAINESQSRLPRDIAKDLNIGLGEPTKAITQKLPGGGKAAKMKGPLAGLGAVILMSDLAKAETPAERKAIMRNAAEGLLPLGVNPTEAGAPGLTPAILESQRQATLLGSPYRKSIGVKPPAR